MTSEITFQTKELQTIESISSLAKSLFNNLDCSETTRKDYQSRIANFISFIFANGGLNKNSFLEYKRSLKENAKYEVSTKNKYLASSRIFIKELIRNQYINFDPTANIKGFTQTKKHKRTGVNDLEIKALLESIEKKGDLKIKLIIYLLAFQGLRQIEITRLEIQDVDLKNNVLMVLGKGKDDKVSVDLHPLTASVLKEYLSLTTNKSGALIVGTGNRNNGKGITNRALQQWIKPIFAGLEIEKVIHGLRHYFTTTLLKEFEGDSITVAKFTRHNSLEMLQVYNDEITTEKHLPKFYNAFSLRDKEV